MDKEGLFDTLNDPKWWSLPPSTRKENLIKVFIERTPWVSIWAILLLLVIGFPFEINAAVILDSSFSLSENYNDNIFFSETNQDAGFVSTISPSLKLAYSSKNVSLSMRYTASAQFYSYSSAEDSLFHSLSFDLDIPFLNRRIKGVEVRVIEEMSFSPGLPAVALGGGEDQASLERRRELPQGTGQGIQLGKTDTFQNQAGILLLYDWSTRFTLTSSYINVITRFSGEQFEDRNAHQTKLGGVYRYDLSTRTAWTGSYGAAWTTGDGNDQLIHSLQTGLDHRLSKLVTVRGEVGVSFFEGESLEPTFSGEIFKRYQSGNMSLRYSRGVSTGLGVVRSVTRSQSIVGSASRRLSERIDSYLEANYSTNKSVSGNEVDLTILSGEVGMSVLLLEWLSAGFNYSHLRQDSNSVSVLGGDGERNVVSVTLTAVAPPWRIIK